MYKRIVGIFVCILLFLTVFSVSGLTNTDEKFLCNNVQLSNNDFYLDQQMKIYVKNFQTSCKRNLR